MANHVLNPEPLSQIKFREFGEVIEIDNHSDIKNINYGQTKRYHDLAKLDLNNNDGKALFNIFRGQPITLPFQVKVIERHPLSSQLFFPLSEIPFLILVAKNSEQPIINDLRLFITNGKQGINYAANTWHHYLLPLNKVCDFVVIDRSGENDNCIEYCFDESITIEPISL